MVETDTFCTHSKNPHKDEDQKTASEPSEGLTESLLDNCTDTEEQQEERRGGEGEIERSGEREDEERGAEEMRRGGVRRREEVRMR